MTAKRFLSQYRYQETRLRARREEIARLRSLLTSGVSHVRDTPRGGASRPWTDTAARILELEERLQDDIERLLAAREAVEAAIGAVEDEQLRMILELRYLNGYGFGKIARTMHYSYDWAKHLHQRALRAVRL